MRSADAAGPAAPAHSVAALVHPAQRARTVLSRAADYAALTKPRIVELLLVTTVPPMVLAAGGWPGTGRVAATLVGGTLTAGAANAYNMVLDRDLDAIMARTRRRPIPSGRITPAQAVTFASALAVAGPALLWIIVGHLAAAVAATALVFYVGVYTAWLKRWTVHNIVIGGAAGAAPPMVGWAAVTGDLAAPAWVLFAVVFLWTPPHFWALAIVCRKDYAAVDVPMLPVSLGPSEAARRSLRYALATVAASLALPLADPRVGWLYLGAAVLLGAGFVVSAARLRADPRPAVARRQFRLSILYLAALFAALMADQLLAVPGG